MNFWTEYFLLVFGALIGALQIAVAHSKLLGLSFFSRRLLGYLFGIPMVVGSFWWFFASSDRNILVLEFPNFHTGMMISCTALALLATFLLTLSVSSLVKANRLKVNGDIEHGLEVLKQMTYFQIIRYLFRKKRQG